MPKKNPFGVGRDARGRWRRQNFGTWPDGTKPTIILGLDFKVACTRSLLLDRVWEAVQQNRESQQETPFPCWDETTYEIALAVGRGESPITLDVPDHISEMASEVSDGAVLIGLWLKSIQEVFPFLQVRLRDPELEASATAEIERTAKEMAATAQKYGSFAAKVLAAHQDGTLHRALDAFGQHITTKYTTDDVLSQYGRLVLKRLMSLKQHQADVNLGQVDAHFVDNWVLTWTKRPKTKKGAAHCSKDWAEGVIKTIREFVRWLDRCKEFDWKKPAEYEVLPVKVMDFPEELQHFEVKPKYKRDELQTIYEYAQGVERLFVLLALNCGFGQAEIGSLKLSEVDLEKKRIKRLRTKTLAPGKWLLWDVTVEGLRWYIEKVRPENNLPWVFLTKKGKPLTAPTKGNNRSQQIPNAWGRVLRRIHKDNATFPKLSFNKLRKTSANTIRKIAGKEIADLFLGHGPAEVVDAYTDRRYGELYRAIRRYDRFLTPVLSVENPFPDPVGGRTVANLKITPGKQRRMQSLRDQGYTMRRVAEMEEVAIDTVRRYTVNPLNKTGTER